MLSVGPLSFDLDLIVRGSVCVSSILNLYWIFLQIEAIANTHIIWVSYQQKKMRRSKKKSIVNEITWNNMTVEDAFCCLAYMNLRYCFCCYLCTEIKGKNSNAHQISKFDDYADCTHFTPRPTQFKLMITSCCYLLLNRLKLEPLCSVSVQCETFVFFSLINTVILVGWFPDFFDWFRTKSNTTKINHTIILINVMYKVK